MYLHFILNVTLFSLSNVVCYYISTFQKVCVVHNMAVFHSSLILCFPSVLLGYFLNDSEMVLVAPVFTGITFVFEPFHMRFSSVFYILGSSQLLSWSHFCFSKLKRLLTFMFVFFIIADYNVRFIVRNVLSVCTCGFHNVVILSSGLFTNFGVFLCHYSFSNFTPVSLHMLKCS